MTELPTVRPENREATKLTIGVAAAVAGIFFPGAGLLGPIADFAIERYVRRPERILIEKLKEGNIEILSDEKAAAFIPMAYKYFEAAKEGEYEHNLKILAELLMNEMHLDVPDVSNFARISRRIEGITYTELKVIVLINSSIRTISMASTDAPSQTERPFVSAITLARDPGNKEKFDHFMLQETLSDLAGRGLLVAEGSTKWNKAEENYFASSNFMKLIEKANKSFSEVGAEGSSK